MAVGSTSEKLSINLDFHARRTEQTALMWSLDLQRSKQLNSAIEGAAKHQSSCCCPAFGAFWFLFVWCPSIILCPKLAILPRNFLISLLVTQGDGNVPDQPCNPLQNIGSRSLGRRTKALFDRTVCQARCRNACASAAWRF